MSAGVWCLRCGHSVMVCNCQSQVEHLTLRQPQPGDREHTLDESCWCKPTLQHQEKSITVWMHN